MAKARSTGAKQAASNSPTTPTIIDDDEARRALAVTNPAAAFLGPLNLEKPKFNELVADAQRELAAYKCAVLRSFDHALNTGEALLKIRREFFPDLKPGRKKADDTKPGWTEFCEWSLGLPIRTANRFVLLAQNREVLTEANQATMAELTVTGAEAIIKKKLGKTQTRKQEGENPDILVVKDAMGRELSQADRTFDEKVIVIHTKSKVLSDFHEMRESIVRFPEQDKREVLQRMYEWCREELGIPEAVEGQFQAAE